MPSPPVAEDDDMLPRGRATSSRWRRDFQNSKNAGASGYSNHELQRCCASQAEAVIFYRSIMQGKLCFWNCSNNISATLHWYHICAIRYEGTFPIHCLTPTIHILTSDGQKMSLQCITLINISNNVINERLSVVDRLQSSDCPLSEMCKTCKR
jgi:hypothetical protein